ncbi:hypothetical protein XM38_022350 [Halomicronema hongdechloris C2206]|uniref:Uncharacterized protein n=1 Tax=Halomicronema hongdechloris C2206 TaxID=1641165 RepID=A0A1Z3HLV2_9CYAN|nr:hypothetical protein [Halomicronema hongdechloris]ASC71283.1 hypothetical protein XM38_022350 [Halomicronema hongdechloris C2206]
MTTEPTPAQVSLDTLPEYELKLLNALAYFLGRPVTAQARACLCMYLRQSEPRIMAQTRYYAHRVSHQSGRSLSEYDLLDWLWESPEAVTELLQGIKPLHRANDPPDVFDP